MNDLIRKTFMDSDGSLSLPELVAAISSGAGVSVALWDCLARGAHFDLQSFGVGVGAIVAALGAAQRLRDGILRTGQ